MLLETVQRSKKAVIVTHVLDNHFRHATLDIVRRLTAKSRRPRKALTDDEVKVVEKELHVLRPSKSPITLEEERELARFREDGIKIFVHSVEPTSSLRQTLSIVGNSATILSQTLDEIFSSDSFLDNHLSLVYIFRPPSVDNDPFFVQFLQGIASKLFERQAPTRPARPLPITVYLPPRPTSSDFDLDLPPDQVLSLQLLHLASETIKAHIPSPPDIKTAQANKFERRSLQLLSSPPPSSKLHRRSLSSLPPSTPSLKSLILRPAPGLVQSVSMRISLPLHSTSKTLDLSLRVTECLPPMVSTTGERFALPLSANKIELPPTPPPSPPLLKSKLKLTIPTSPLPPAILPPSTTPISPLFDPSLYTPIEKPKQLRNRAKPRSRQSSIGSTMTTKESDMDERWREVRRLLLLRRGKANDRLGV